ncbi:MAG: hypothetical protein VX589_13105 [Myxococcota bacterium]|nr:hypothetical protein [Myxococcota bacterium]
MSLAAWAKMIVVGVLIYVAVQFSVVWVNYAQLGTILDAEALEARRHRHTEKTIIDNVISHMNRTATNLPIEFDIGVSGTDNRDEPIEIEMDYVDVVDLHLVAVPINLTVTGIARPPAK